MDHNEFRNATSDCQFYLVITCIVTGACAFLVLYNVPDRYFMNTTTKSVKWDLDGLEKELGDRVYGQVEVVNNVTKILRDKIKNPAKNHRPVILFLLGGPGVGKTHVQNIIRNHAHCEHTNKTKHPYECQLKYGIHKIEYRSVKYHTQYLDKHTNGAKPEFIDISSFERSLYPDVIEYYFEFPKWSRWSYNTEIFIVTGSLMTDLWAVGQLKSTTQYESYMADEAENVYDYFNNEYPQHQVFMLIFKPLNHDHVNRCLNDQRMNNITLDYSKDFVPMGCKTRHTDI